MQLVRLRVTNTAEYFRNIYIMIHDLLVKSISKNTTFLLVKMYNSLRESNFLYIIKSAKK